MLLPEFRPVTFSYGLIEAPLDRTGEALDGWYTRQGVKRELNRKNAALPELLRELEPLSAPFFKRLWVQTASPRWPTAYFDGFINGGDPAPPLSYLAIQLGCRSVALTSQPDRKPGYGANRIEIFGPGGTDAMNREWSVAAINDGERWTWQRSGPEQPFEETDAYALRKIRDRLTPERLERYARALEIPLDPAAYGPGAFLDVPEGLRKTRRRESLLEARKQLGLD